VANHVCALADVWGWQGECNRWDKGYHDDLHKVNFTSNAMPS